MTRSMDHNHTDKYQVSLCIYFETQITLICALFDSEKMPKIQRENILKRPIYKQLLLCTLLNER